MKNKGSGNFALPLFANTGLFLAFGGASLAGASPLAAAALAIALCLSALAISH